MKIDYDRAKIRGQFYAEKLVANGLPLQYELIIKNSFLYGYYDCAIDITKQEIEDAMKKFSNAEDQKNG